MGAPTSNSSNASKASKPTPDAAVAHSVARLGLVLMCICSACKLFVSYSENVYCCLLFYLFHSYLLFFLNQSPFFCRLISRTLFLIVSREFLALEQSLNRFGAQPLRQPPTKPSSAYSSSSSSGSSGRGYSGFNSLSPFLKGNGALSPSSLTRRNGGSSGHSGSNLTSLAEEETPPSDETSYSRGDTNTQCRCCFFSTPHICNGMFDLLDFSYRLVPHLLF